MLEWGNRYSRFSLRTDSDEVRASAESILSLWPCSPSARFFGEWSITEDGDAWRVAGPPAAQELLRDFDLPPNYPTIAAVVKAVEFQTVYTALSSPGGPPGFHGALLGRNGNAIGLVGNKEAGKSTLSTYLWRQGYELYSDDGFQIDIDSMTAIPAPRRSRVRPGCRSLIGEPTWESIASRPTTFADSDGSLLYYPGHRADTPLKLTAIVLLRDQAGELEELNEAEATMELVVLNHLYYSEGLAGSIASTSALSNSLKSYRLGRGTLASRAELIGRIL